MWILHCRQSEAQLSKKSRSPHETIATASMYYSQCSLKESKGFFSTNRRFSGGSSRKAAACAGLHRKRKCASRIGGPWVRRLKRSGDSFSTALTIFPFAAKPRVICSWEFPRIQERILIAIVLGCPQTATRTDSFRNCGVSTVNPILSFQLPKFLNMKVRQTTTRMN